MNKHQKAGCVLLLTGVLLVLCALGVHLVQEREDKTAGQTAAILLQQLENKTQPVGIQTDGSAHKDADPALPRKEYMGYALIGSIRIDAVGIYLPILDDWSEETLKVAPCRYQGSLSGGNMIIMGHNYKSHFNPLHKITVGAEVEFENVIGQVFRYRVARIEYLHRNEGEKLPSDDYPLTIFTCTPGGLERIVVRCEPITK